MPPDRGAVEKQEEGQKMEQEDWYEEGRMLATILELSMRVGTGGRMVRGSMITFCRDVYGTRGKTEKALLGEMLGRWEQTYGRRFEMESAYERAGLPTVS